jgi:actin-related protein
MHKAPVLSTYLFALESSLVVDIGAEYTHIVPVIEGFINTKGIIRASIGGETITRELYKHSLTQGKYRNNFMNQELLTDKTNEWGAMVPIF